ncbi:MAG: ABC transporter permease [Desulfurococcaceae archaeon]
MPGAGMVIARRGLILLFSFILIIIIISAIIEGSGYSKDIYEAIVRESVNAEIMALRKGNPNITESYIREYRENLTIFYRKMYGLIDEQGREIPPYVRMWNLVKRALTLDLGKTDRVEVANVVPTIAPASVSEIIAAVLPRTIIVVTVGELIVVAIALLLAPRIAYRHGTIVDRLVVAYAAVFTAVPIWWLAMIFIQIFGYQLGIFPTSLRGVATVLNKFWENPVSNTFVVLKYITLPISVFVIATLGSWLYGLRAMLLRVIREDYVTVAKAKGLPEKDITRKYVLRVSLAPVLTNVILALASSLGGMIITESVFDWPGMGTLYYNAIISGDSQTIMGLFVVYIGVYLCARFILEILYIIIDPRVRVR